VLNFKHICAKFSLIGKAEGLLLNCNLKKMSNKMVISIIITTKNEEHNIPNCLESIKNSINPTNPINSINPTNSTSCEEKGNLVNFGALTMHIVWFMINTGGGRYEEVKYYLA